MENEAFSADIAPPAPVEQLGPMRPMEEGPRPVRLPGRPSWQSASNYQLWLVGNELVHVCCPLFTESYARIALGDVQAITLRRTATGRLANLFLTVVMALSLLILEGNPDSFGAWGFFGALAAGCLVLVFLNTVQGPTCECHLRTAVRTHRITALGRWRSTRRTVDQIKSLIEGMQGAVDIDDLLVAAQSDLVDRLRRASAAGPASTAISAEPVGPSMSTGQAPVHTAVFGLFLAGVPICLMDLYLLGVIPEGVSLVINFVWFLTVGGLSCFAAAQQRHMPLPDGIKTLTWVGLVYVIVLMFLSYWGGVMATFEQLMMQDGPESFTGGDTFHVMLNSFGIMVDTGIGLVGLLSLRAWRRSHETPVTGHEEEPAPVEPAVFSEDPVVPTHEDELFEEPE